MDLTLFIYLFKYMFYGENKQNTRKIVPQVQYKSRRLQRAEKEKKKRTESNSESQTDEK